MNISINSVPADITLDTEKTLGDVLSGIEQWISPTGNRIRGIAVNGILLKDNDLAALFNKDICEIKDLDIDVSSWRELAAEALYDLLSVCTAFGNAAFSGRGEIASGWDNSPASRFIKTDIPGIYELVCSMFSGEGLTAQGLCILIEERLREVTNPAQEIASSETLVFAIAGRMAELPLDIQTGKDQQAAETMQLFSRVGEKLFRIFSIYKSEGLSLDTFIINGQPARIFMEEFNAALGELSDAYENNDTVLVGDLAEYELSPRLLNFFSALKDFMAPPALPV